MNKSLAALSAIPIGRLGRRPDIVFAFGLAAIVAMLIVPLPAFLLDALIALNIALAVTAVSYTHLTLPTICSV